MERFANALRLCNEALRSIEWVRLREPGPRVCPKCHGVHPDDWSTSEDARRGHEEDCSLALAIVAGVWELAMADATEVVEPGPELDYARGMADERARIVTWIRGPHAGCNPAHVKEARPYFEWIVSGIEAGAHLAVLIMASSTWT